MSRYIITISVRPIDGSYGDMDEVTYSAGKQRCQNTIKNINRMLAADPCFTRKKLKVIN